jgi:hypothetical protein
MTELEQALRSVVQSLDKLIRAAVREELKVAVPPPPKTDTPWLDEQTVGARLGVSNATLQSWRYRGVGPTFYKIGRFVRYRADDVERWVITGRRGTPEPRSHRRAR